ncbi:MULTISPECIES: flagellar basal body-associated protein FliL [Clostridia]|uniref:flagellar basal body-associated protein FliL n=1 Tax=Clostridia TaxID=186801 RepID=UPI000EA05A80|nr:MULTISPECIES: flagellar basal body-associated protein FliL [Clostridia]NBJ68396.1 flagellar basal body-associated protein FliL [Roseburia sp. 1XD42-34]RKI81484.1 flagellar basal body-associated protein FliL [Clostridium sp. 1xD42-85]
MSKLVKTMLTSLTVLLIIGISAFVVVQYINTDEKSGEAASIDEMKEYSYETPEITTDLQDGSFVRIQFQIIADSKDAKEEIEKRDFQLKNILIKELATMKEKNFQSGLEDLENEVKSKLNEVMTTGKITDVYTINKILQ